MKENKKRNALLLLGLLIICFLVIDISYAIWSLNFTQTDSNVVTTGCFKIEFTDQNSITLDKAYPITDEEGKSNTPYEFTLTNTCDGEANYYINLETITSAAKKLNEKYIKASLKKGEEEIFLNNLNSSSANLDKVLSEASAAYKLYQGKLKAKEVATFSLNLWLLEDTPPLDEVMDATYEGKITVLTSYNPPPEKNLMIAMGVVDNWDEYENNHEYYKVFNSVYSQNKKYEVYDVRYESTLNPYPNALEVVDFSEAQDKSVLGYYVETDNAVVLHIQADGKIKVNPKASYYGTVYQEVTETGLYMGSGNISGLENWDTSLVTDMSYMFNFYQESTLDLSDYDTTNVTNMNSMFWGVRYTTITYGEKFIYNQKASVINMFLESGANKPTHESWNNVLT